MVVLSGWRCEEGHVVHSGTRGKHNYLNLSVQPVQDDDQPIENTQLKSSGS